MINKCWDIFNNNEENEYIIFKGLTPEFVRFVNATFIEESKSKKIKNCSNGEFFAGGIDKTYYFENKDGFNGRPKMGDYIVVCYNDNGIVDYVIVATPEQFKKQWITQKPICEIEGIKYKVRTNFEKLYDTLNDKQKYFIHEVIEGLGELDKLK